MELENTQKQLYNDIESIRFEQSAMENKLNAEIERLLSQCDDLRNDKENEVESLSERIRNMESDYNEQIVKKDNIVSRALESAKDLQVKLDSLENLKEEKDQLELVIAEKEKDNKVRVGTVFGIISMLSHVCVWW